MRPTDNAFEDPSGTDGSAGQSPTLVAAAPLMPARTAPDDDAGSQAGQPTAAVWDQPLPWATPRDGGEEQSTGQNRSARAESTAAPASPALRAAAVRDESGEDAPEDAEAAGTDSSVELWQAVAAEQQRGGHAAPARSSAAAAGSNAVSRWLLGAAVAAGGLLAAVGVAEGLSPHRSAATVEDQPEPIPGPDTGLSEEGPSTPTMAPTTPARVRLAAGAGKAAVAGLPAAGLVAPHAEANVQAQVQGPSSPAPAHTPEVSSQRAAVKPPAAGQSSYLSVQTSVQSPDGYWSQSSVTVTTAKKLTALKIVLHVAQTGGVANTGVWTSLGDEVAVHAAKAPDGGANYVVTLIKGHTVDSGTYVFQFGYNHDKGARDTVHDLWSVVATAVGDNDDEDRSGRFH